MFYLFLYLYIIVFLPQVQQLQLPMPSFIWEEISVDGTPPPIKRWDYNSCVVEEIIYYFSGRYDDNPLSPSLHIMHRFDTSTMQWLTPLNTKCPYKRKNRDKLLSVGINNTIWIYYKGR